MGLDVGARVGDGGKWDAVAPLLSHFHIPEAFIHLFDCSIPTHIHHTHERNPLPRTYALVGTSDPLFKETANVRCVEKLDQLPKVLTRMCYGGGGAGEEDDYAIGGEEEDRAAPIYVKVVRPHGTGHTVVDLPGAFFLRFACVWTYLCGLGGWMGCIKEWMMGRARPARPS